MHSLDSLFAPCGVVVIGASSSPKKLGAVMAEALRPYGSAVALVNSRNPGRDMHASVADALGATPGGLDLAVICVPAASTASALRESAESGIRAALVCSGGFSEIGIAGAGNAAEVAQVLADTGIRLLGPNTSGFFVPHRGLRASFVPGVAHVQPGPVAIVAASGGVNHVLAFQLQQAGVGVSLAVGIGAGTDVNTVSVLEYLVDDERTKVVALHVETVSDGPALLAALGRISSRKPVVALVVGRNDVSEFAESHTGALATSWRTTRAALAQAGAVLVDDEAQMVDALIALSGRRLSARPRPGVGLITGQAGPGLIIADALKTAGIDIPLLSSQTQSTLASLLPPLTYQANPVDTGRPGRDYDQLIAAVANDPSIDLVAVYGITEPVADLPALVAASGVTSDCPVLIGVDGSRDETDVATASALSHGVPLVRGPSSLAKGIIALVEDARTQYYRDGEVPVSAPADSIAPQPNWDEVQGKKLLNAIGIATPDHRHCASREQAASALVEIGGPVAVKLVDSNVLHKSDIGGVRLGIDSEASLNIALDDLESVGAKSFLIEAMAQPGVDLILGVRRDPLFGPIVVLGIGGVAAEVMEDIAVATLPINRRMAEAMPQSLLARSLLDGFRGGPTLNRSKLTDVILRLGATLLANDHISEIEINPLRITAEGLIALDAVVINAPIKSGR